MSQGRQHLPRVGVREVREVHGPGQCAGHVGWGGAASPPGRARERIGLSVMVGGRLRSDQFLTDTETTAFNGYESVVPDRGGVRAAFLYHALAVRRLPGVPGETPSSPEV